jgi:hypothetical protein
MAGETKEQLEAAQKKAEESKSKSANEPDDGRVPESELVELQGEQGTLKPDVPPHLDTPTVSPGKSPPLKKQEEK